MARALVAGEQLEVPRAAAARAPAQRVLADSTGQEELVRPEAAHRSCTARRCTPHETVCTLCTLVEATSHKYGYKYEYADCQQNTKSKSQFRLWNSHVRSYDQRADKESEKIEERREKERGQ